MRVSKSQFKARALKRFQQIEASREPGAIAGRGQPTLEVRPHDASTRDPLELLRGSLLRYEEPTAPVAEGDWEPMR